MITGHFLEIWRKYRNNLTQEDSLNLPEELSAGRFLMEKRLVKKNFIVATKNTYYLTCQESALISK